VKRPLPAAERLPASCRVMTELVNLQAALLGTLPACRCSDAQAEALRGLWDSLKADMERYVRGSEA
jgi:predicted secreted Zn-dependent protease